MKAIFDPDTPGGLAPCIACRAFSSSTTTDAMVQLQCDGPLVYNYSPDTDRDFFPRDWCRDVQTADELRGTKDGVSYTAIVTTVVYSSNYDIPFPRLRSSALMLRWAKERATDALVRVIGL